MQILRDVMPKFPQFANLSYSHFYSGPRNSRQPSKASFVEFQSSDDASNFLRIAKSSPHLKIDDKELKIKLAMTAINRKRNWSHPAFNKVFAPPGADSFEHQCMSLKSTPLAP